MLWRTKRSGDGGRLSAKTSCDVGLMDATSNASGFCSGAWLCSSAGATTRSRSSQRRIKILLLAPAVDEGLPIVMLVRERHQRTRRLHEHAELALNCQYISVDRVRVGDDVRERPSRPL